MTLYPKAKTFRFVAIRLSRSEQIVQGYKYCAGEDLGAYGKRQAVTGYGNTKKEVADDLRRIADEIEGVR